MKRIIIILVIFLNAFYSNAQWNLISSQDTLFFYTDVEVVSDSTIFVCGIQYGNGVLLRSQDMGNSWDTTIFNYDVPHISFPSVNIGYLIEIPDNVYKTVDGGDSWSLIKDSLYFYRPSMDLLFINADTGYISSQDNGASLYRTFDGGINWTQLYDSSLIYGLQSIGGRELIFSNGVLYTNGGGIFLKSSDLGENWISFTNDSVEDQSNTIDIKGDTIWTAGHVVQNYTPYNHYGVISRSFDGGINWNVIEYQQYYQFRDIQMISNQKGFMIGGYFSDNIAFYKTVDGGDTWGYQQWIGNNQLGFYLTAIDCFNDSICFAVGSNGSIFKTTNGGGGMTLLSESLVTINIKLKIYPNPANDFISVETEEKSTLEIINMQGQIVDTKSLTEKVNNLDLSNLVSGVYTLRIKTDRGIAIRKLIKQ